VDVTGATTDYYCFGLFIDPAGQGHWLPQTDLAEIAYDGDDLPCAWRWRWWNDDVHVEADVTVRQPQDVAIWGAPDVPQTRRDFVFIPLVTDGQAVVRRDGGERRLRGYGLAEYWRA
jgi:hypothetical protein